MVAGQQSCRDNHEESAEVVEHILLRSRHVRDSDDEENGRYDKAEIQPGVVVHYPVGHSSSRYGPTSPHGRRRLTNAENYTSKSEFLQELVKCCIIVL